MSIHLPEVCDKDINGLITDMNTRGYAVIQDYLRFEDLRRMQLFVETAVAKSGYEYCHFNGPEAVRGSGLEEIASSSNFEKLMHGLYERTTGQLAPNQRYYQILRCLIGESGRRNSMIFHYDSYIITALFPIHIPIVGMAGDLLMYPNKRCIRDNYLINVIDKVLIDNPLSQHVLRAGSLKESRLGSVRLKLRPGSVYFFWGYRSIHANEPCDVDKIRATAVFHYANPHRPY